MFANEREEAAGKTGAPLHMDGWESRASPPPRPDMDAAGVVFLEMERDGGDPTAMGGRVASKQLLLPIMAMWGEGGR